MGVALPSSRPGHGKGVEMERKERDGSGLRSVVRFKSTKKPLLLRPCTRGCDLCVATLRYLSHGLTL